MISHFDTYLNFLDLQTELFLSGLSLWGQALAPVRGWLRFGCRVTPLLRSLSLSPQSGIRLEIGVSTSSWACRDRDGAIVWIIPLSQLTSEEWQLSRSLLTDFLIPESMEEAKLGLLVRTPRVSSSLDPNVWVSLLILFVSFSLQKMTNYRMCHKFWKVAWIENTRTTFVWPHSIT